MDRKEFFLVMKIKLLLILILSIFMISAVPAQEQTNAQNEENQAGPPMEIQKDIIGLAVLEDGSTIQKEDEKIKITSKAGVEKYSKIIRFYITGEQKVNVTKAKIIKKDGQEIQLLGNPEAVASGKFEPLQGSPLYKNLRMLTLSFDNLEIGDVIEYCILIQDSPYPGKAFWGTSMSQDTGFMKKSEFEFSCPEGTFFNYITYRQQNEKMPLKKKTSKNTDIYSITFNNVQPLEQEMAMPPTASLVPKIMVSSMTTWNDLAILMNELTKNKLQADDKMKREIELLKSESTTKDLEDKIYNLVKNSKKIIPLGYGLGTYRLNNAAEIYKQRVISSADAAVLLCALYKEAGFDARLALVASSAIGKVAQELPSIQQFDTLTVALKEGNGYKWIDSSFRSPFLGELPADVQGSDAFVFSGNMGNFAILPLNAPSDNREDVAGEVALMKEGTADAVISLDFFGVNAYTWNELYSRLNSAQRQNIYRIVASRTTPNANIINKSLSTPKAPGDPFNIFIRYLSFGLVKKTKDGNFECHLPILSGGDFRKIISDNIKERTVPVFIGNPCQEDRRFRISLPEGIAVIERPKTININNDVGAFQVICEQKEQSLYYHSRLIFKKTIVEKQDFNKLMEILEAAEDARNETITMTGFNIR